MNDQTIDLGTMRAYLEQYLAQNGYWGDAELRRRNAFTLSPSAYAISQTQYAYLDRLARTTYAATKTLSRTLSTLSGKPSLLNGEARLLKFATNGKKGLLGPADVSGAVPPVLKVDLVQDPDGRYHIAEVDAYNPRGLGYIALLDDGVPAEYASQRGTLISQLAAMLKARQRNESAEWNCIVSEFERYYETIFGILARRLDGEGVYMQIVREGVFPRDTRSFPFANGSHFFCIPESLDQNISLRDALKDAALVKAATFFYPPTAYLGSKVFLPFLRDQSGMEEFIPQCVHVCKKSDPLSAVNGTPVVLKGVMSSGLKKVIFSDTERVRFDTEYAQARTTKNPQWILQHQVPQEPLPIVVFDDEGNRTTRDYFLRIVAYVSEDGFLGAAITGRTDRAVHGAPDCIQIPMIAD